MANEPKFTIEEIKNFLIEQESTDINDLLAHMTPSNIVAANVVIKDEGEE